MCGGPRCTILMHVNAYDLWCCVHVISLNLYISHERSQKYLRGQPGVRILCYGPPDIPLTLSIHFLWSNICSNFSDKLVSCTVCYNHLSYLRLYVLILFIFRLTQGSNLRSGTLMLTEGLVGCHVYIHLDIYQ